MAEKYFDTQALLGVVIRDPTILGADITGYSVTVNANYDWPESGKPFVPGYSLSMNPNTGLSVYQASSPSSGGLVLEMLTADNQYVPWYFDRMRLYTGSFSAVYLTNTRFIDGDVEFREITDFSTLSDYPNTQQYVQKGVQAVGELIITDRQTFDPYSEGFTNAPASLGVSSRASLSVNPQNITKMSQMVMRTSNQGDSQFATKDTILEIDKAGAAITPKIGPGAEADSIKIVSGALAAGNTRGAIEISSNGSVSGINDITLTGRLVVVDAYTRSNSNGRILAVTSGGGVGYTQTPAMTRAWATSTVEATLASTTHGYQVGSTTGANIAMGPSQIMGRNNGAAMRISVPGGFTDIPDPVTGTDSTSKAWVENYVALNGGTQTDTGWLDCTLASGWVASTAAGQAPTVQARKIGNQVRFRGRASGTLTVGATTTILTIPVECRPPIDSNMNAVATTGGFTGWSNATSSGALSVHFKTPFATGATVIEFTGMSYLTN